MEIVFMGMNPPPFPQLCSSHCFDEMMLQLLAHLLQAGTVSDRERLEQ
jgi:hypothetical protein